ncbi:hypothetical protein FNH22_21270 [Fulvivirga sp. M361]|uniref:hypothetical protein n=1 Tax=Fulvivirga sp. M361 TaxID=2594266 RepID=UPI00117BB4CB|nr:hypothetical protein [Fulvivirga sp. M361]TRX53044.1 hypothetical protein FNH22_21270 [Fulvivirga sp. M361]
MQQPSLIFEHSPLFLLLAILAGLGYALLLYKKTGPWGVSWNKVLFALRWLTVSCIAILLISPILKQIQNEIEPATFIIAVDNSSSMTEAMDSAKWEQLSDELRARADQLRERDFAVEYRSISNKRIPDPAEITFQEQSTDLNQLMRGIQMDYEGRNLGGVLLLSDGIHNNGRLPTYADFGQKIYSLGIGDTVPKSDIILKSLKYNKISYQGNKFPLVVQVLQKGFTGQQVTVSVQKGAKVMASKSVKLTGEDQLNEISFYVEAAQKGYQSFTVVVSSKSNEFNFENNEKKAYVEVIEGREKIALVAAAPHPDVKAIRSAIESNENYSFEQYILSIPGDVEKLSANKARFDLVILHQIPGRNRRASAFVQRFKETKTPLLWTYGGLTDMSQFNRSNGLLNIKVIPSEYDEVTAAFNPAFGSFSLTQDLQEAFDDFPPLVVPFGRISLDQEVNVMLYQRVGTLTTNKPLVAISDRNGERSGVVLGSGLWRWKLTDYARQGNNKYFNELISKLVQFLSSKEDKRKFKAYPVKNEFRTSEPVIFESETYNDLYERIYGNRIDLILTDEQGKSTNYTYVPAEGNTQYAINGLGEGVYSYSATTSSNGEKTTVKGEFLVEEVQLEDLNLTADYNLLRKLSKKSGGDFFSVDEMDRLTVRMAEEKGQGVIHSDEKYLPFINLKWIFFLLLALISSEWFIRKYNGSY